MARGDPSDPITVALVEDHVLVRGGITAQLLSQESFAIVYSGDQPDEVAQLDSPPDVVLLDLDLNGRAVTEAQARALIARGSEVIVVSAMGSPSAVRAMIRAGASGFVSKRDDGQELIAAIHASIDGRIWMTQEMAAILVADPDRPEFSPQERRALELYASGLKLASVARAMGVQPTTAKEYIDRVRVKYAAIGRAAPTKAHLTLNARDDGLLSGPNTEPPTFDGA